MHLPQIKNSVLPAALSPEEEQVDHRYIYLECLRALASGFCQVLHQLNGAAQSGNAFMYNGIGHSPILLKQRNMELLAVIIANLGAASPVPSGFGQLWPKVKRVGDHLKPSTPLTLLTLA